MTQTAWIGALVAVGLVLIVLEVFVPSGGVLGLVAFGALAAGVVTAFVEQGAAVGMGVLAATFVAVPLVLGLAFRVFPATALGRRVLPPPPGPDDVLPDAAARRRLRGLVGSRGRAVAELVPYGAVEVAGAEVEAVSEGGPIAAGAAVEVVGVQAGAVVVRIVADQRAVAPQPAAAEPRSALLEEFDPGELWKNTPPGPPLDPPPGANES